LRYLNVDSIVLIFKIRGRGELETSASLLKQKKNRFALHEFLEKKSNKIKKQHKK
jgi:hypothetical protein